MQHIALNKRPPAESRILPAYYSPHVHVRIVTRCLSNVDLMLTQRRRRWPNIKPALDQRLVFTGTEYTPP